jgi:Reverse transcriptase (RNA-dependent DNA polymerase)
MSGSNELSGSRRHFLQAAATIGAGLSTSWPHAASATQGQAAVASPEFPRDQPNAPGRGDAAICRPDRIEVAAAVERALVNIIAEGVDPNFPTPFEIHRLRLDAGLQRELLETSIDYFLHPLARSVAGLSADLMSVPKSNMFGYRHLAQVDVGGAVNYLAAAILIARRLEAARIPVREERIFSYRFVDRGQSFFDENCDYAAFSDRTLDKLDAERRSFLVSADIANFYPSIDSARLMRKLNQRGVEPWLTTVLDDTLFGWKPQWRHGLPVGPVASNVIAEMALIDTDAKLLGDGIDFIRYVDDYRIFAADVASARHAIGRLAEHLHAEGLTLNQAKSSVEAVSRPEYAAILNGRRMARYWNQPFFRPFDRIAQVPSAPAAPNAAPTSGKDTPAPKVQGPKSKKKVPCRTYGGCSPFKKSSQLDDHELDLLNRTDPAALLSSLLSNMAHGRPVQLGDFRTVVESACHSGKHALIGDAMAALDQNPPCVVYLADVLIAEREKIPAATRRIAGDWFAARLLSNRSVSDHEVVHIATLLGVDGYRRPEAIHAYLKSEERTKSSIALRALLAALETGYDGEHLESLVEICCGADVRLRRAVLDLSWRHLDSAQRMSLASKYSSDFEDDPFLRRLLRAAEVSPL